MPEPKDVTNYYDAEVEYTRTRVNSAVKQKDEGHAGVESPVDYAEEETPVNLVGGQISDEELAAMITEELVEEVRAEMNRRSKTSRDRG